MHTPAPRKPDNDTHPCPFCGPDHSEGTNGTSYTEKNKRAAAFAPGCSTVDSHIVVVHHQPDTLKMIAAMFRKLGYTNVEAIHTDDALQHLSQRPCDLLFTDLDMPDPDGYNLAGRLKQHHPRALALVMTARCHAELVELTEDDTVDRWLYKPFTTNALHAILSGIGMGPGRAHNFSYGRPGFPTGMTFNPPMYK